MAITEPDDPGPRLSEPLVSGPRERSGGLRRVVLTAGGAAAVLGVAAGLWLAPQSDDSRETKRRPELAATDRPQAAPQPQPEPQMRVEVAEAPPLAAPPLPEPRPQPPVVAPEPPLPPPRVVVVEPPRPARPEPPRVVVAERPAPRPLPPFVPHEPLPQPRRYAEEPRPSFNCRYARSESEQMVCSDSELAAADRELHEVFERAMARTDRPRALRREQDRWLAHREAAAPDPAAVLDVYVERIAELDSDY